MVKFTSVSDLNPGDRVFYELGEKIDSRKPNGIDNWISKGLFKEIWNMKGLVNDQRLNDEEYVKHHNFVVIKSTAPTASTQ